MQNSPKTAAHSAEDFRALTDSIMRQGNRITSHLDFLREIVGRLLEFSNYPAIELRLRDNSSGLICIGKRRGSTLQSAAELSFHRAEAFTRNGNVPDSILSPNGSESVAIPLLVAGDRIGILELHPLPEHRPDQSELKLWESLAATLGFVILNQRAQWALRERVKELTCLYGIANLIQQPGISLAEFLQGAVALLPPGWQYPEITCARIRLDDAAYVTSGFRETESRQSAEILVRGEARGSVDLFYLEEKPELDEGPFLREERNLITALASQLAIIIERREAEEERSRLEEQLRHADRLATIGQLAAGVAHELNEPLGGILGFAQLARKSSPLPEQAARDIDRIIAAALYAREIVKNLLFFARQMPPKKTRVNINRVVYDVLSFFENRCARQGIQLITELDPNLPEIVADSGQLHQVVVNLVVNAIQAIPETGRITLRTAVDDDSVLLVVQDTGLGMSREVQRHIFVPFFTTKDVKQGTGIGLSVAHGIVVAHGGKISFESEVNRGSSFTIRLPLENHNQEQG